MILINKHVLICSIYFHKVLNCVLGPFQGVWDVLVTKIGNISCLPGIDILLEEGRE